MMTVRFSVMRTLVAGLMLLAVGPTLAQPDSLAPFSSKPSAFVPSTLATAINGLNGITYGRETRIFGFIQLADSTVDLKTYVETRLRVTAKADFVDRGTAAMTSVGNTIDVLSANSRKYEENYSRLGGIRAKEDAAAAFRSESAQTAGDAIGNSNNMIASVVPVAVNGTKAMTDLLFANKEMFAAFGGAKQRFDTTKAAFENVSTVFETGALLDAGGSVLAEISSSNPDLDKVVENTLQVLKYLKGKNGSEALSNSADLLISIGKIQKSIDDMQAIQNFMTQYRGISSNTDSGLLFVMEDVRKRAIINLALDVADLTADVTTTVATLIGGDRGTGAGIKTATASARALVGDNDILARHLQGDLRGWTAAEPHLDVAIAATVSTASVMRADLQAAPPQTPVQPPAQPSPPPSQTNQQTAPPVTEPPKAPPEQPVATAPVTTPAPLPTPPVQPTPVVTPAPPETYRYLGFSMAKLAGASSFVGRRTELVGGSTLPVLPTTVTGNLGPVSGVTWQWYSYFSGDRGTQPTYSRDLPIAGGRNREGTVTGSPNVSNQEYSWLLFGQVPANAAIVTGDTYIRAIENGYWLIGRQTDAAKMPTTGTAQYFQGGLDGLATTGEAISGRFALTVQFDSRNLSGWMHFRRADGSRWGLAQFPTLAIQNGRFSGNGTFQSYLNPSNSNGQSSIFGSFYGPAAQEIGGGWNLWNSGDALAGAMGIFRGKSGFAQETAPAPPTGSVGGQPGQTGSGSMPQKFFHVYAHHSTTGTTSTAGANTGETVAVGQAGNITFGVPATMSPGGGIGTYAVTYHLGAYQHTAWGEWAGSQVATLPTGGGGSSSITVRNLVSIGGQFTDSRTIPATGSATYNGELAGYSSSFMTPGNSQMARVGGSVNLTANFSARTLNGSFNVNTPGGTPWIAGNVSNLVFSDNTFGGPFGSFTDRTTGQSFNGSGGIGGNFFGPVASNGKPPEIGGYFNIYGLQAGASGMPPSVSGVFRAKQ